MMKKELRAVMAKYGDTYQTLAQALGITVPALSHKVNVHISLNSSIAHHPTPHTRELDH